MTHQFTDEVVEAAAKALYELDPWLDGSDYRHLPLAWEAISDEDRDIFRPHARAALEAAAGAAPQAESDARCNCAYPEGHARYCPLRPVQALSTVDEAALAEVIANAGVDYNLSDRSGESYACGAPDYRSAFIARAVVEAIGGESRGE